MRFKDKYSPERDIGKPEDVDKIFLEDEAYAVCELLELILDKLEHIRLSSNK